jgi:hypothetical protein
MRVFVDVTALYKKLKDPISKPQFKLNIREWAEKHYREQGLIE